MAAFIMAGPMQATAFILAFALLSWFLPLLGLLSNAAIGLVTLRLGWRRGLTVALGAGLALALIALLLSGQAWAGLMSGLFEWLIVLCLAAYLGHTGSWQRLLLGIFGCAALGVVFFHLSVPDAGAFWKETLQALVNLDSLQERLGGVNLQAALDEAAPYLTGLFATALGFGLTLSLMIARHWQARLYNPGGFQQELAELQLGKTVSIALLGLIAFALLELRPLVLDLILLGLGLFLFQGIAVVHGIRNILAVRSTWLLLVYVPLALLPVQFGILLAAMGLMDSFADFRGYLRRRPGA